MRLLRDVRDIPYDRTGERLPMILDVDTGIDDTLALIYAAAHPDIDLAGVTCVAGNVPLDDVVHNTLGVLETAGRADVEVAAGAAGPVARPLETTPETHGPHGIGYAQVSPSTTVSDRHAVDLIVETARRRPGEVTLVTLGPLTNLAAAVLAEPRLPLLLRDVFIMGGTFFEAGNAAPRVEWNIHVDPEAAKIVFHRWSACAEEGAAPLTVMGLDVTETSRIDASGLADVARACGLPVAADDDVAIMSTAFGDPLLDLVRDSLRFYFEFHETADGFYGAHIHDPFVVGAALDPSLIHTRATVVDVQLGGAMTDGETVADWRGHLDKGVNARVAVAGDGAAFGERLRSLLADAASL
ncbi:nucleoside hydrolase [Microbacterium aquimaris]|uniref:Nucleoside hydrolase n=1 Tax=Microbacterium aquimaris TaxID=459816 RepID=A0ABU5N478_9MICO|nr:nucleoside hydrolase [Microbacterium aquimaris]MDZ8160912.1 nucleoside hydrolase [Microbacterium aquimaris]